MENIPTIYQQPRGGSPVKGYVAASPLGILAADLDETLLIASNEPSSHPRRSLFESFQESDAQNPISTLKPSRSFSRHATCSARLEHVSTEELSFCPPSFSRAETQHPSADALNPMDDQPVSVFAQPKAPSVDFKTKLLSKGGVSHWNQRPPLSRSRIDAAFVTGNVSNVGRKRERRADNHPMSDFPMSAQAPLVSESRDGRVEVYQQNSSPPSSPMQVEPSIAFTVRTPSIGDDFWSSESTRAGRSSNLLFQKPPLFPGAGSSNLKGTIPPAQRPAGHAFQPSLQRSVSSLVPGSVTAMVTSPARPPIKMRRTFSELTPSICAEDESESTFAADNDVMKMNRMSQHSSISMDGPDSCPLPHIETGRDALKRISCRTLVDLMMGRYQSTCPEFAIVDCRFPYEFDGGHIQGARNMITTADLEK
ncbi:hypothetical protein HDU76_007830, partial [Blyttiomyces sp. JEL0837]